MEESRANSEKFTDGVGVPDLSQLSIDSATLNTSIGALVAAVLLVVVLLAAVFSKLAAYFGSDGVHNSNEEADTQTNTANNYKDLLSWDTVSLGNEGWCWSQKSGWIVNEPGVEKSPPFKAFTCFPKLPPELRLKIWRRALPGPRLVPLPILVSSRDTIDADSVKDICDICKNANSSVNSFIRVCCESYDVSKPYCHKLEAQSYPDVLLRSISPKLRGFRSAGRDRGFGQVEGVKRLAICNDLIFDNPTTHPRRFKNLVANLPPSVEFLTILNVSWLFFEDLEYEYQLVSLPNSRGRENFHPIVSTELSSVIEEERTLKEGLFESQIEEEPQLLEYDSLRFDIACMARRQLEGLFWTVGYIDQLQDSSDFHCHWEPVALVHGGYRPSFKPLDADSPIVPHGELCDDCKAQRWPISPKA